MANNNASVLSCKKCKAKVVNGWKCIICGCYYHTSCGKLRNVKIIDDNLINCCEKSSDHTSSDGDTAFFDAMNEISGSDKKVNVNIFHYIIKQKDVLIDELQDKIKVLNRHIELLNKTGGVDVNVNTNRDQNGQPIVKPNSIKNKATTQKSDSKSRKPVVNMPERRAVTNEEVSVAVAQVETQLKLDNYINLVKDESAPPNDAKWSEVVKTKRKRRVVIGSNKESTSIEGVPGYAMLHVYRIKPQTTAEEFRDVMKKHFPEIKCESLNSKNPDLYSSFKVTILSNHFKKAMDATLWPFGACISRFLSKRRTSMTGT